MIMESKERIFFLQKKSLLRYQVLDVNKKLIGDIEFRPLPLYKRLAIILLGLFLAILNYYVFIIMYLSFKVYGLFFLSFIFGLIAFAGSFLLILIFIRLAMYPLLLKLNLENSSFALKISRIGIFNLKYIISDTKSLILELRGFIFKSFILSEESGEIIFSVKKEKGFYLFKNGKHYFGYFSRTKSGVKVDLSPDINQAVDSIWAVLVAALISN